MLPTGAVPPPLRTWFELTARWSRPLTTHNSVLTPERVRTEDGKRVFCVENQSVWEWGMETADDDPAVYDRLNEAGEEWLRARPPALPDGDSRLDLGHLPVPRRSGLRVLP